MYKYGMFADAVGKKVIDDETKKELVEFFQQNIDGANQLDDRGKSEHADALDDLNQMILEVFGDKIDDLNLAMKKRVRIHINGDDLVSTGNGRG